VRRPVADQPTAVNPAQQSPWQAADVFPAAPGDAPCGVLGANGPVPGQDADDLVGRLRRDVGRTIVLAWTQASPRLVPVGEVPDLAAPLAERDLPYWQREARTGRLLAGASALGVLVTLALVPPLALLPLFLGMQGMAQALAARQALRSLVDPSDYAREQALALRFAAWSGRRGWRGTQALAGLLAVVAALVLMVGEKFALPRVGMDPAAVRAGDWWRLATAGLVHYWLPHLLINLLALLSLGRLVEALAGWRGMLLAFVVGTLGGNALSALLAWAQVSVGASSGLSGLLGWLLIASQPRPDGVPATLRAAVCRNVWLVALLGVLGAGIVDHAAHVGGLVAGAGLAALNGRRLPANDAITRGTGIAAGAALIATAAWTAWVLLAR